MFISSTTQDYDSPPPAAPGYANIKLTKSQCRDDDRWAAPLRAGSKFSPHPSTSSSSASTSTTSRLSAALEGLDAPKNRVELTGTFLEWTMTERNLLLVVDLQGEGTEAPAARCVAASARSRLPSALPRVHRLPRDRPNERDDFPAAVRSFPIAAGAALNCATIEYDAPKPKPPRTPLAWSPKPAAAARVERKARQRRCSARRWSVGEQISGAKQQIAAKYEKVRNDAMDTSGSASRSSVAASPTRRGSAE